MDNIARLLGIMARLRDPARGCPWDLKQTFASIVPHTLEEAYEVADAIERGDFDDLKDELGDLLLQVVFYAQLAREQNLFDFDQVAEAIADKLVRRHPHVFGDAHLPSDEARAKAWEAEKARERNNKGGETDMHSVLNGVALALPALTRAGKLQKRAADVGFDWKGLAGVLAKIEEELMELRETLADKENETRIEEEEEVGDLLFAVVKLARWRGIDAECALRAANAKFERRFRAVEAQLKSDNRSLKDCELAELDPLWEGIKQKEHKS
jgi:ATP diphosphatase